MSHSIDVKILRAVAVLAFVLACPVLSLAEEGGGSVEVTTGRYIAVKGDEAKFRAHHWMKDGFVAGIEHLNFDKMVGGDTTLSVEGRSLPEENDNELLIQLQKNEIGFVKTEYTSFRKYYDESGGVYHPNLNISFAELTNQDLRMDMGHFLLEAGLGPESDPDASLMYERHTKKGKKSRLTWTAVKDNSSGLTRNIGPAWQQVDEVADIFTLKGKKEVAGVMLKGEQKAEFVGSRNVRQEQSLARTGVKDDEKIRIQEQKPEANVLTSTLRGEKWVLDDKTFLALGYRYAHVDNSEYESLREFTRDYVPYNFGSFPEQKLPSWAENRQNEHIWTGHMHSNLTQDLAFISKMKVSYSGREGSSRYPNDKTPTTPDGIVNTTELSTVENKINRLGENFSLRYSGISKTSLYAEVDLEQTRNWISEYRDSLTGQSAASDSDRFLRETLTGIQKTVWTIGGRIIPTHFFNATAQFRKKAQDSDYDDIAESVPTSTAKSAFMDQLKVNGDEFSTKLTWKPWGWLQNSFRYQLVDTDYIPRVENEGGTKNQSLSHIFTYDITWQPKDPLLLTMGFTREQASVTTSAGTAATAALPGFQSDVNTWLFSASYAASEKLNLINTVQYSRADNFNNYAATGLPMGTDYASVDASLGIEWKPKKDVVLKPFYEYFMYDANPMVEVGDYTAHLVGLDVGIDW